MSITFAMAQLFASPARVLPSEALKDRRKLLRSGVWLLVILITWFELVTAVAAGHNAKQIAGDTIVSILSFALATYVLKPNGSGPVDNAK